MLSACQYAQQSDYPADHPIAPGSSRDSEGVMIGGGSVIYSPMGEALAGPLWEGEGVLSADLDLDDVIRGKFDLDVVGHYARPDSKICIFSIPLHNNDSCTVFQLKVAQTSGAK